MNNLEIIDAYDVHQIKIDNALTLSIYFFLDGSIYQEVEEAKEIEDDLPWQAIFLRHIWFKTPTKLNLFYELKFIIMNYLFLIDLTDNELDNWIYSIL